jgi:hypothetical protein
VGVVGDSPHVRRWHRLAAMKARPCRETKMSLHHDLLILCARIDFDP